MKKSLIAAMIMAAVVCTGCDTFRKLAGRPTSSEIEIKRAEIVRMKELEHKIMMDSLAAVEKALSDSLAIADSLENVTPEPTVTKIGGQERGHVMNPSVMGGLFTAKLDYKYYVVVGAFADRNNAEKMLGTVNASGYTATILSFRNGLNAVGTCPTDDLNQAFKSLDKVSLESFCPADAWILVNE